MNIIGDAGNINIPGDIWDQVVIFYTQQLGPVTSNDGAIAIWQQEKSKLQLTKITGQAFTGVNNVFVGWSSAPKAGKDLNVLPVYPGKQVSTPYTVSVVSFETTSDSFVGGKIQFGVIYNPPD